MNNGFEFFQKGTKWSIKANFKFNLSEYECRGFWLIHYVAGFKMADDKIRQSANES